MSAEQQKHHVSTLSDLKIQCGMSQSQNLNEGPKSTIYLPMFLESEGGSLNCFRVFLKK